MAVRYQRAGALNNLDTARWEEQRLDIAEE
jgi:hypothetical protein